MAYIMYESIAIALLVYGYYRFTKRISPGIPYAGEESFLARLRVPKEYNANPVEFLTKQKQKYGDVFCVDLFVLKFVFLLGPEGNRSIFRSSEDDLSLYEASTRLLGPFQPKLIADPQFYEKKIKVIRMGFSRQELLQGYAQICDGLVDEYFQKWSSAESVPLFQSFSKLSYAIIFVILFGDEFYRANGEELMDLFPQFEECIHASYLQLLPYSLWKYTPAGAKGLRVQKRMTELISSVIKKHYEQIQKGIPSDDSTYIAFACQQMDRKFERHIALQMSLFVFAFHANVSQLMAWFVLHSQAKPGTVERCRAEIEIGSSLGKNTDTRDFSEACLRETVRLYTSANIGRCVPLNHPDGHITVMGHTIPAGTFVFASPGTTHRDPALFENPESWRPERFLEDEDKQFAPLFRRFEYLQFGYGAHACPGDKLARVIFFDLFFKTWMREYDIKIVGGLRDNVGLDNVGAEADWPADSFGTPPMLRDAQMKVTNRTNQLI